MGESDTAGDSAADPGADDGVPLTDTAVELDETAASDVRVVKGDDSIADVDGETVTVTDAGALDSAPVALALA
jgi:hypothetical protein